MKLNRLTPLLAALMLAACQTPEVAPTIVPVPSAGYARGIDMATDSSDVMSQLQGRRWLGFVARYYRDPTSRWPALSVDEARRLSALGVKIVTVWEWHSSNPAYFTYASGYNDALSAHRQAKSIGQPPGSAIYFAVDFNARGAAMAAVDQYFRGVAAGLAASGRGRPEYRVGVYGSGAVCAAVRGAGLAQYAWLSGSTAWDGTAGYNDWSIRQGAQGARFANLSFDHDSNEARADYGGFQIGNYAGPPPVEPVMAVATAAPAAAATLVSSAMSSLVPPAAAAPPPPAPPPVATQVATVPAPSPPPAPAASPAPRATPVWTAAAVEVAALAAAEPRLPPPAPPPPAAEPRLPPVSSAPQPHAAEPRFLPASAAPPPRAAEPEPPPPPSRHSAASVASANSHERAPAHVAAKPAPAAKGKVRLAAVSSRAAAAPARHAAVEAHEPARKASAHKSEEHVLHPPAAKPAAAHSSERTSHHHTEPR